MPIVSVITPAYNAERWIDQTIKSVLDQSFRSFELIIVDDGSSDATASVISNYKDERIRLIQQSNQGLSAARNTGIEHIQGNYIGFLDADDLWHPDFLAKTVKYLDNHQNMAVVRTGHSMIDEDNKPLPEQPLWGEWEGNILERLLSDNCFVVHAALLRRQCLDIAGRFDPHLTSNEDWDFWLRIAVAGFQFGFIAEPLALYRKHAGGMTSKHKSMLVNRLEVLNKAFSQPELTHQIGHLKGKAYAEVYRRGCVEALRNGDIETGFNCFQQAISHEPSVLCDLSLYYQIACINVPEGHQPSRENLDLHCSSDYLEKIKQHIFMVDIPPLLINTKQEALANLYLALGMVHYNHMEDMSTARHHFLKSLRFRPMELNRWLWFARALTGKKRLVAIRSTSRTY